MNSFVTFACLLAVAGVSHGSAIGYGGLGYDGLGGYGLSGLGGLKGYYGGLGLGGPLIDPLLIKSVPLIDPLLIKSAPLFDPLLIKTPIIKTIAPISPIVKTVLPYNSLGLGPIAPLPLAYSSLGAYGFGKDLGYGSVIKH